MNCCKEHNISNTYKTFMGNVLIYKINNEKYTFLIKVSLNQIVNNE
jgi:hypothetical protein